MQTTTLYYREGSSDKTYSLAIAAKDQGFVVNFAYGRRGSTLNTGTKTGAPVTLEEARRIYDNLLKKKTAKGYHPGEQTTTYQAPMGSSRLPSGIQCQLLNPVADDHVEVLLCDREHWMQEKKDGRRLLLRKQGDVITAINRLGLIVSVPESMVQSARAYPRDFLMDGEAIGDSLHCFDILSHAGEDVRHLRFADRLFRLRDLLKAFDHPHLHLVDTYCFPEKQDRFRAFKEQGAEGVVFKQVDAPYQSGRPSSGGTQLKHKFCETASLVVTKVNDKRSVSLILFEGDRVRPAGNVTIPPNHDVPTPGTVVECRYLYAFPESGCLYQPIYLGARDDIRSAECTTSQLKFKTAPALAAA